MVKIPPHRAIRSPVTLFKVRDPEEESWSARLWREKTPGGEGQSIGMAHRVCAAEDAIALGLRPVFLLYPSELGTIGQIVATVC